MDIEHAEDPTVPEIQQSRIERGAQALGPDGALGTVEQIVVDRTTGELESLVVRGEAGMDIEISAQYIERASGDRVYLSIGPADLARNPELAQPYTPDLYAPVDQGTVVPPSALTHLDTEAPVLTEMEPDAVSIATPVPPADTLPGTGTGTSASLPESAQDLQEDALDIGEQPTLILGGTSTRPAPETPPAEASADPLPNAAAVPGAEPLDTPVAEPESPTGVSALESWPSPVPPLGTATNALEVAEYSVFRSLASGLAAASILLGAAAAGVAYLLLRRRQRTTLVRSGGVRASAATARARLGDQMAALGASVGALQGAGMRRAATLGSAVRSARDQGAVRAGDLGSALVATAQRTADAAARAPQTGVALSEAAGDAAREMTRRAQEIGRQRATLAKMVGQQAQRALARKAAFSTRRAGASPTGIMRQGDLRQRVAAPLAAAGDRLDRSRQATMSGVGRARRRARWFQRGLALGVAWALLYAPESGTQARRRLAAGLRRIPGLGGLMGGASDSLSSTVAGTGPHPQYPIPGNPAPFSGVDMTEPLLTPTSEEGTPLPPTSGIPDVGADEIAGMPGV